MTVPILLALSVLGFIAWEWVLFRPPRVEKIVCPVCAEPWPQQVKNFVLLPADTVDVRPPKPCARCGANMVPTLEATEHVRGLRAEQGETARLREEASAYNAAVAEKEGS